MAAAKCLVPDCPHEGRWRGLCMACEQAALRAIAYGRTTWEELYNLGLASEPSWNRPTNIRGHSSRLIKALKAARKSRKGHVFWEMG